MNNDLLTAKNILQKNGYACVLCLNGTAYHSNLRGVRPLVDFLESGTDFCGFSAADKTVGAGAAHLYVLLGVRSVWANVLSRPAAEILRKNNVAFYGEQTVDFIKNRTGDGTCPIESAVKGISSCKEAFSIIKETLEELRG